MTFEEAKKILKKEGFYVEKATRPCAISESFFEYEDPTICEAMHVVNSAGYFICMEMICFDERKSRLKKELEEHANAPVSGKEQPKEKKGIIYPSTSPKADFYYKHVLNEGNPALREASSQFNDALLYEQSKKIKRLGKEISKLNIIIHDKNAVLSDVAEELRLTKIREKNLAELCLKYVGENEKLKKELSDKVIDKIDARALKSAESALAYKEKVIAEKDDVIADLGKELASQKDLVDDISLKYDGAKYNLKLRMDECEKLKKELDSNTKMVQKMAEIIVHKKPVTADVFKKCCIMAYNEEKLSKVLDDVIDQFLLFGEIIIKEEK